MTDKNLAEQWRATLAEAIRNATYDALVAHGETTSPEHVRAVAWELATQGVEGYLDCLNTTHRRGIVGATEIAALFELALIVCREAEVDRAYRLSPDIRAWLAATSFAPGAPRDSFPEEVREVVASDERGIPMASAVHKVKSRQEYEALVRRLQGGTHADA